MEDTEWELLQLRMTRCKKLLTQQAPQAVITTELGLISLAAATCIGMPHPEVFSFPSYAESKRTK